MSTEESPPPGRVASRRGSTRRLLDPEEGRELETAPTNPKGGPYHLLSSVCRPRCVAWCTPEADPLPRREWIVLSVQVGARHVVVDEEGSPVGVVLEGAQAEVGRLDVPEGVTRDYRAEAHLEDDRDQPVENADLVNRFERVDDLQPHAHDGTDGELAAHLLSHLLQVPAE